jgi:hypothetical protein
MWYGIGLGDHEEQGVEDAASHPRKTSTGCGVVGTVQ